MTPSSCPTTVPNGMVRLLKSEDAVFVLSPPPPLSLSSELSLTDGRLGMESPSEPDCVGMSTGSRGGGVGVGEGCRNVDSVFRTRPV